MVKEKGRWRSQRRKRKGRKVHTGIKKRNERERERGIERKREKEREREMHENERTIAN